MNCASSFRVTVSSDPHAWLESFWGHSVASPAAIPGRYLNIVRALLSAQNATGTSNKELGRLFELCACPDLLANVAAYFRDSGVRLLPERPSRSFTPLEILQHTLVVYLELTKVPAPECDLVVDLGMEPLDVPEILAELEARLDIYIPEHHLWAGVKTVADAAALIERLRAEKEAA